MNLEWEKFKHLFHPSWHVYMKSAIESEWMFKIFEKLKKEKEIICPSYENVFNSFLIDLNGVHTILILQEPYAWVKHGKIVANGIPMDCSNTGKMQPSLEQFYTGMEEELKEEIRGDISLSYLSEQGVMLLNSALTCKANKVGSHSSLWIPFMKYIFEEIFYTRNGTIYWMLGAEAKRIEKFIYPLGNYIFHSSHPASASHKGTTWSSEGIFTKINKILKENSSNYVIWNPEEYKKTKFNDDNSIPF